jgi:hypothetical protein
MNDSAVFVVPASAGPGRLKAGLQTLSASSILRSPQYDGDCPFCRREVRWLKRLNRQGYLAFEDISSPDFNPENYR